MGRPRKVQPGTEQEELIIEQGSDENVKNVESCKSCKFAFYYGVYNDEIECHRNAPAPKMIPPEYNYKAFKTMFPVLSHHNYCGEYQKK